MSAIAREIKINAAPEKVWEVLSDYTGVAKWSPSVLTAVGTTSSSHGVGAGRACAVPGFGDIVETVTAWHEGESFTFRIAETGPIKEAVNSWGVREAEGGSIARVTVDLHPKYGALGAIAEKLIMRRKFAGIMEESLLGLRHYVQTGEEIGTELPEDLAGDAPIKVAV